MLSAIFFARSGGICADAAALLSVAAICVIIAIVLALAIPRWRLRRAVAAPFPQEWVDILERNIEVYRNLPMPLRLQLRKLINVIKLRDLSGSGSVQREMALICVRARPENRDEILRIVDIFRCKVVDVGAEYYIIEATGTADKMKALVNLLKPMGIKKIARTGTIALFREPN